MSTNNSIPDYDFIPLPLQNTSNNNKIIVQVDPNSQGGKNMSNIQNNIAQNNANTQYDTINSKDIKPLAGGKKEKENKIKYIIEFRNKKYMIEQNENIKEEKIIKEFIKKQSFKNDQFISCLNKSNKNKNFYHIKDNKKIQVRKLY